MAQIHEGIKPNGLHEESAQFHCLECFSISSLAIDEPDKLEQSGGSGRDFEASEEVQAEFIDTHQVYEVTQGRRWHLDPIEQPKSSFEGPTAKFVFRETEKAVTNKHKSQIFPESVLQDGDGLIQFQWWGQRRGTDEGGLD